MTKLFTETSEFAFLAGAAAAKPIRAQAAKMAAETKRAKPAAKEAKASKPAAKAKASAAPAMQAVERKDSTALAIAVLRRKAGASAEAVQEATGWSRKPTAKDLQRLASARGRGFELVSFVSPSGETKFRFEKAEAKPTSLKAKAARRAKAS